MKKIGLQDYLLNRKNSELNQPKYRVLCTTCMHPEFSCYCKHIEKFDPLVQFVILIHPIEYQRRIATGRMSHLILKNSLLIRGQDFSDDQRVNQIVNNQNLQKLILYPSHNSINLSDIDGSQSRQLFSSDQKWVVFVIDGTWATARQMMRQSQNLQQIQRVCFTPNKISNFRVRKQPEAHCLSTIEAIHQFMEISGSHFNFDPSTRSHDALIKAFDQMVERQIQFAKNYT